MEILDNFFSLNKRTKFITLLNFILGATILCIQILFIKWYFNNISTIFIIFIFLTSIAYIFNILYNLYQTICISKITKNLENLKSYNSYLARSYDSVRGFKHDFDNIINIISGYIQLNDMLGLKQYFSSLEKDCILTNNIQVLNPKVINNAGIYHLLTSKYKKASDLNITFNLEILFDFRNLKMSIYEFSKILGILLDNSIEASKDCNKKIINLSIRENKKLNIQILQIENTYSDKNVDINEIFKKGVSNKQNHSGIGLWEVNEIIKKNKNIVLNTKKDDNYFIQELQILI